MRSLHSIAVLCAISILSTAQGHISNNPSSSHTPSTPSQSASSIKPPPTCRSGTVNYITHRLPQQCMTSSRPAGGASGNQTASSSPSTTESNLAGPNSSASSHTASTIQPTSSALPTEREHDLQSSTSASSYTESASTTTASASLFTTTVSSPSEVAKVADTEAETDSPLDNANFLSFEEWKKQNLVQAGQSPDHVGQQRSSGEGKGRTRPGINNALDVLGEDTEIELDFSGFGTSAKTEAPQQDGGASSEERSKQSATANLDRISSNGILRGRDAGKTCKERTNYASFDCAATVVKSNVEGKSASSVLIENKDSYMLNTCSVSNKFFIVELCDDILIDTVVLANYEFFSSIFRTFRLSVSDRYPVKADRWKDLGIFEASNTRNVQAFLVDQPLIWARYLRIEFLTHYGSEYYCPVSLLRVHGTTMMEEFRHQEDVARGDYSEDVAEEEKEDVAASAIQQEPAVSSLEADASTVEQQKGESGSKVDAFDIPPVPTKDSVDGHRPEIDQIESTCRAPNSFTITQQPASHMAAEICALTDECAPTSTSSPIVTSTSFSAANSSSGGDRRTKPSSLPPSTNDVSTAVKSTPPSNLTTTTETMLSSMPTKSSAELNSTATSTSINNTTTVSLIRPSFSENQTISVSNEVLSSSSVVSNGNGPLASSIESSKHASQTANAPQPMPTTQESFFKSIHKRLQMLESNATLSLQYIEEQSRILRDAFSKVEKRQIRKTETFLDSLNATVSAELQEFRQQYDQLWQSTVIELETHREQYQREILAVSARLAVVADELLFQKRMVIVQSTLLMLCLGFVLFARSGSNTLELPLLQQMVNKRASFYSPPASPSPDGPSPQGFKSGRGFWRRRTEGNTSEGSIYGGPESQDGPELLFQPPTPTSPSVQSDVDEDQDEVSESTTGVPQETQSGPATPTGTRDIPTVDRDDHEVWPRPRSP